MALQKDLQDFFDDIRFKGTLDQSLLQNEWIDNILSQLVSIGKGISLRASNTQKADMKSFSSLPVAPSKANEITSLLMNFLLSFQEKNPSLIDHVAKDISDSSSSFLSNLLSLDSKRRCYFSYNALRARALGFFYKHPLVVTSIALQSSIKNGYGYRTTKEKGAITIDRQIAEKGVNIEYKIYSSNSSSSIAKSLASFATSFLSLPIILEDDGPKYATVRVKFTVTTIENISQELKQAIVKDKDEDGNNNRISIPLFVYAVLNNDNLDELHHIKSICNSFNMWLHVEGNSLGLLTRSPSSANKMEGSASDKSPVSMIWKDVETARDAHSILLKTDSIDLFSSLRPSTYWLSAKFDIGDSAELLGLEDRLSALPIWMNFRTVDGVVPLQIFDTLKASYTKATELIELAVKKLSSIPSIQFYQQSQRTTNGLSHLFFRYQPPAFASSPALLNRLNEQILMDLLETEAASPLGLHLHKVKVDTENSVFYIGYSPLHSTKVNDMNIEILEGVLEMISVETNLIDSTLSCRDAFKEALFQCPGLTFVEVDNFVGLGAVRYVPPYLSQSLDTIVQASAPDLYSEVNKEIDEINSIMAESLSGDESLFSKSTTPDGKVCITIGVETPNPLTVEATQIYVRRLFEVAKKTAVTKESSIMGKISEVIQRSIKQAEDSLTKEEEQVANQEGIIRQLPVVGSVWNWLSPISPKDKPKVHGRSFNLLVGSPTSPVKPSAKE